MTRRRQAVDPKCSRTSEEPVAVENRREPCWHTATPASCPVERRLKSSSGRICPRSTATVGFASPSALSPSVAARLCGHSGRACPRGIHSVLLLPRHAFRQPHPPSSALIAVRRCVWSTLRPSLRENGPAAFSSTRMMGGLSRTQPSPRYRSTRGLPRPARPSPKFRILRARRSLGSASPPRCRHRRISCVASGLWAASAGTPDPLPRSVRAQWAPALPPARVTAAQALWQRLRKTSNPATAFSAAIPLSQRPLHIHLASHDI